MITYRDDRLFFSLIQCPRLVDGFLIFQCAWLLLLLGKNGAYRFLPIYWQLHDRYLIYRSTWAKRSKMNVMSTMISIMRMCWHVDIDRDRNNGQNNLVRTNDVFFAVHAFLISSFTLTQTFMYTASINWSRKKPMTNPWYRKTKTKRYLLQRNYWYAHPSSVYSLSHWPLNSNSPCGSILCIILVMSSLWSVLSSICHR